MNPDGLVVTASEMRAIEEWTFAQGLPVAALMERAGLQLTQAIRNAYPGPHRVGVLVGPGHNGADALVVARELHQAGYAVQVVVPTERMKSLTQDQLRYFHALGGRVVAQLQDCTLLVDGLLGFGLAQPVGPELAGWIERVNAWGGPVVSIDVPSGLDSDTGAVWGAAIRAEQTLCLGLWKQGLLEDRALDYCGAVTRLDLHLPPQAIQAIVPEPTVRRITPALAQAGLPLPRPLTVHKHSVGRLLLIAGSRQFPGAALLAGLGAQASGVGWLALAIPEDLRAALWSRLPDAIFHGCPLTEAGRIAAIPVDPTDFQVVACGPGLGWVPELVRGLLALPVPLVLDADGLNSLGVLGRLERSAPTVITPHTGEFRRLFPDLDPKQRIWAARQAALQSGAVVVLKGARTVIASPDGVVWVNPESTPALARAGSGDVLTGLLAGLMAQGVPPVAAAIGAVWCHSQAALRLVETHSVLGVDPVTLSQGLRAVWATC